jgi:hypothetical protein
MPAIRGLVTSDFAAASSSQLSATKDSTVVITAQHPSGYYLVEHDGQTGWIKKANITVGQMFVPTANYDATSADELSLTSGTMVRPPQPPPTLTRN